MSYLSPEAFEATLERLLELRREGKAWLLVSPAGVSFVYARHLDADQRPTSREREEVEEATQAVLSQRSVEKFAARREQPPLKFFGQDEPPEPVADAKAKLDAINQRMPILELRRRRWLKSTSKTSVPRLVEWDAVAKHADDTIKVPGDTPVPVGVFRLAASGPAQSVRDVETDVVVTLDSEDIDYMIARLTELRTKLKEMGE